MGETPYNVEIYLGWDHRSRERVGQKCEYTWKSLDAPDVSFHDCCRSRTVHFCIDIVYEIIPCLDCIRILVALVVICE